MKLSEAVYPIRQALQNGHSVICDIMPDAFDCLELHDGRLWFARYSLPDGKERISEVAISEYVKLLSLMRRASRDIAAEESIWIIE